MHDASRAARYFLPVFQRRIPSHCPVIAGDAAFAVASMPALPAGLPLVAVLVFHPYVGFICGKIQDSHNILLLCGGIDTFHIPAQ